MKATIKYTFRALLFLLGMTAFCVLVGEPTEALSLSDVIIIKALAFGTLAGTLKGWMLTLSKTERLELENERV